ncbi:hypothetical protein [Streptomyces akebiae]|uniref:Uncharacterized protein n=1 Tax=Streptomyces akebiae TaxID=2865673 RepID=A0ABX8XJQ6_9ACTN|nr:hypothetical protein [Streptomyces akebiae]QYX75897.1 hypothetical protein K1J60_04655 [Streptomyces akebiae]
MSARSVVNSASQVRAWERWVSWIRASHQPAARSRRPVVVRDATEAAITSRVSSPTWQLRSSRSLSSATRSASDRIDADSTAAARDQRLPPAVRSSAAAAPHGPSSKALCA